MTLSRAHATLVLLIMFLSWVLISPVAAQEQEPPVPQATPEEVPGSLENILSQRHSFRFVNEDIQTVLRGLARAYRFNITISPEVVGKVTANFRNVKLQDVIDNILKDFGYGYRESGDILRVTTLERLKIEDENEAVRKQAQAMRLEAEKRQREAELAKEPMVIKVYRLRYVDANNVRDAIQPILSVGSPTQPQGTAVVLETKQFTGFAFENVSTFAENLAANETREFVRSNTLIVKDKESVIREVNSVIAQLDRKPNQIMIDAKIIEVPIDQDFRFGLNWSKALDQLQIGVNDAGLSLTKGYQSTDTRTREQTKAWGTEQDRLQLNDHQIVSDRSTEISSKDSSGTVYPGTGPFIDVENSNISSNKYSDVSTSGVTDSLLDYNNYINSIVNKVESIATASNAASMLLSAADFQVLLSAIKSDSDIVILSNPRVIVHENYAANIFIGERYPILKTEFDAAGGASAGAVGGTSVEEWREIGITLKVIPQLRETKEGEQAINMIVHPAVSSIQGFAFSYSPTGQIYQSTYPIIAIREADTNVTISNGDTLVIGGLIKSYTADETSKVPLLGDIPILGYLFKEDHEATKKTNLLIFITARVVKDDELSAYEKMMLEKSPAEALEDVIYIPDTQVRPYLYRDIEEPGLTLEEGKPEAETEKEEEKDSISPRDKASMENNEKRIQTKARERNPRQ